ncbi:MAG: [FeFe] hydrogenase H-cluster maturation GTPase HydF [Kiritimatiellae bacterium]|jgi:[FeFe] hydrogenase H-cluster maturation GTPase HydF|nr:[FeFe] hydrogenase H-cluster maturation GTPase HydF [Kiritimatiellia bacterium]
MSLNNTPRGERTHIALFGCRNAGKSSLINALTGQKVSIVSEVKGTTTDPVYKAMELLPLGPITIIDTPGLDDIGDLGSLRIERTHEILNKSDIALLVVDTESKFGSFEEDIIALIKDRGIPLLTAINKADLKQPPKEMLRAIQKLTDNDAHIVSAETKAGVEKLKLALAECVPETPDKLQIVGDLINPSDIVVLVTPIDKAAPKGRLILPQQQTIRDILEADAIAVVTKEFELRETLEKLGTKPKLVITDSQVFAKVSADTPTDIPLTSFSILFARYKGDLEALVRGATTIEKLKNGSRVLISEGCTHHRQSDDIGTVKIPRWIRQHTGKDIIFEHTSGMQYPKDLDSYELIIHCGACMLNKREMMYRIEQAKKIGIPIVNYGVLIAYLQGILPRCLGPIPGADLFLKD